MFMEPSLTMRQVKSGPCDICHREASSAFWRVSGKGQNQVVCNGCLRIANKLAAYRRAKAPSGGIGG